MSNNWNTVYDWMGRRIDDPILLDTALLWIFKVSPIISEESVVLYLIIVLDLIDTSLSLLFRSDPLEEIVGLDIGYTGDRKHRNSTGVDEGDEESEARMKQYLEEFEHRQRERAYFKKMANERRDGIPASSIHQYSLHGSSYHGKKIVTPTSQLIESLDTTGSNAGVQSDSDFNDNPVTLDEERAGPSITAENGVP